MTHVARLKKFYEITVQKKVLREETSYTKRGREIWEIELIALPS
jgi:hypothetical protein